MLPRLASTAPSNGRAFYGRTRRRNWLGLGIHRYAHTLGRSDRYAGRAGNALVVCVAIMIRPWAFRNLWCPHGVHCGYRRRKCCDIHRVLLSSYTASTNVKLVTQGRVNLTLGICIAPPYPYPKTLRAGTGPARFACATRLHLFQTAVF